MSGLYSVLGSLRRSTGFSEGVYNLQTTLEMLHAWILEWLTFPDNPAEAQWIQLNKAEAGVH